MSTLRIENALISTSDKLGLADFARGLVAAGVRLLSTGGTRAYLENQGIEVTEVSAYTGFPEIMDGRVKTLHPRVHGGILFRRDHDADVAACREHGIDPIDLVVVNLYPFESTVARTDVTHAEAVEQIDIGGPTLIRAAAKNHAFTTVATEPQQYSRILEQVEATGGTTLELRHELARAAFQHTAQYDRAIADYFVGETSEGPFSRHLNLSFHRRSILRYGENPHQSAALYVEASAGGANLATARQLNGKELSYNNLLDLDSALAIARGLPKSAAVVIKHNNPCGAASAQDQADAARRALDGDPTSAFGSVLGFNEPLTAATAEVLTEPDRFVEAIVAPAFENGALEILTTRPKWKNNVRLMAVGELVEAKQAWDYRRIDGGLLKQQRDDQTDFEGEWTIVTHNRPDDAQHGDLRIAWNVVRHVKSNAIVLCADRSIVGVGAGQMSRVDAVEIAIRKAGERSRGSVLASDAFFPFADSIDAAAEAGVTAIIQPGGSRRDEEVVAACDRHDIAMVFTGRRHFKH